ncbi:MAG: acyl-CoA desaturase [Alcanivoracaceae bacterium]|nr:acyl-CoA desaturase [Alcanivoracaceae bacterium]
MTSLNHSHSAVPVHPSLAHLSAADRDAFADEVEAIEARVMSSLGARDARYIRRLISAQRWLELVARLVIFAGILHWSGFIIGALMLALAKILENMEIGHNVLHGQWDWLRDPDIQAATWEWDNVCPSAQWQRSHNHLHHKWTNVIGMDRDFGYHILRLSDQQPWHPGYLVQPVSNLLMALFFQWGVAIHDDELATLRQGETPAPRARQKLDNLLRKIGRQLGKDYLLFPLLAGPFFLPVLAANAAANLLRNLWAYAVIFCGHFPDDVHEFTPEQVANEDRGHWYLRQVLGSANISGGPLMHLLSGNLSHQIEHHLYPRMPSNRYAEVAPQVRELCARYGIPYNSHGLARQLFTVWRKVFRYAVPGRNDTVLQAR